MKSLVVLLFLLCFLASLSSQSQKKALSFNYGTTGLVNPNNSNNNSWLGLFEKPDIEIGPYPIKDSNYIIGGPSKSFDCNYSPNNGMENNSIMKYLAKASIDIDIKVFLEGPFFNSQMTPYLNVLGDVPLTQPYNTTPWNYAGDESVSSMPNADIIDWILIDILVLENDPNTYKIVGRKAAFLLKDATLCDLDGTSFVNIGISEVGDYYACINHRNHLPVISSVPLEISEGIYVHNFTTEADRAIGGISAHKEIEEGIWGMIAGDGNGSGEVDNTDKNDIWNSQVGLAGYHEGDFNMDSQVNDDDISGKWSDNAGKGISNIAFNLGSNSPPLPPFNPNPEDGSLEIGLDTDLSWDCADPEGGLLTYSIYFGSEMDPPLFYSGFTSTTFNIPNLEIDQQYYWRIVAIDIAEDSTSGEIWTFSTFDGLTFTCGTSLYDNRDGQTYNTVQIGEQCWMAENLNIGERIDGIIDQSDNETLEKYCYNNIEDSCDIFGGLYQWHEMMGYTDDPAVQGICPEGWHVPTDVEWFYLESYIDPTIIDPTLKGWRGVDCGSKLKTGGTSGFNALFGGQWNSLGGGFININSKGLFKTSTSESSDFKLKRVLWDEEDRSYRNTNYPHLAGSVRCLKDPLWNCGDILLDERDEQEYHTVQIGTQCWMAENLNIGERIDGIINQSDNEVIEKYCYDNFEDSCDVYGGLYQWDEMMEYNTIAGIQGICPQGWHIPTDTEWFTLENHLDPTITDPGTKGWRGLNCGTQLKKGGSSGFNALFGGHWNAFGGGFININSKGLYNTSSSESSDFKFKRVLWTDEDRSYRNTNYSYLAGSVRCIK